VETQRQNKQEIGREIDLGHLLRNYWKAAKRFWWVLLITTVLFAGLLPLVMSLIKTPEYEATCSFTVRVVSNSVTSEMGEQFSIYYDKDLAEQLDKTFTYILTSDHLGDEVKQQLGKELEAGKIKATCIAGSNLFELKALGASPEEALQLLETVIDVFPDAARYVVGDMVVDMMEMPESKPEPSNAVNGKLMAVLGAALGFVLGSGILILPVMSLRTVRRPEELEEVLNMPCLGLLPLTRERMDASAEGEFRESVRGITRKLEHAMEHKGLRVLLVTSTLPGEGKSLVARFVAQTLADWGNRVYLVDGDLRKPSLHKSYKLKGRTLPLEAFLRGQAPREAVICDVGIANLRLVGNSQSVEDPTVLLDSPAVKECIEQLKGKAGIVVIDAPPCDSLSDVIVLERYADALLYVVRQDYAPIHRVADAVESLCSSESKLLGYVLNGTAKTAGGYGKYGYGAYSYGKYGNGYYGKYGHYSKYSKYYHTEQLGGPSEK